MKTQRFSSRQFRPFQKSTNRSPILAPAPSGLPLKGQKILAGRCLAPLHYGGPSGTDRGYPRQPPHKNLISFVGHPPEGGRQMRAFPVRPSFLRLDRLRWAKYVFLHGVCFPFIHCLGRESHNLWLGTVSVS